MSALLSVELSRKKISSRFGHNKTEELCRLLYEIGRRETIDPNEILEETIVALAGVGNLEADPFRAVSFSELKRVLLKRRFPSFSEKDFEHVYLSPLRLPDSSAVITSQPDQVIPEGFNRGSIDLDSRLKISGMVGQFIPTQIFIEKPAKNYPLAKRVTDRWPHVPTFEIESIKELKRPKKEWLAGFGKRTIAVSVENFDLVKPCPCSASTVSCNYYLLNIGYGCPFDCSYCYLQDYQNLPAIVLPANVEYFLEETGKILSQNPKQFARIGTGEFADSLALDWLTEYSKTLVPFFADKNVILELKTKSDCVQNLIGLNHGGKTVVAWSVSPARFQKEEKGTASILARLDAAKICEDAGYGTAYHFDPIMDLPGIETDYEELVEQIFSRVSKSVRWISMGTLRFHRDLRQVAEFRHPESDIFLGEGRLDPIDGKMRYPGERRVALYKHILEAIRRFDAKVPIYLCMESGAVWKSVFEGKPYEGRIDEWIGCSSAT